MTTRARPLKRRAAQTDSTPATVICTVVGMVPYFGWLLAFAVGFGLLMAFTQAEWVDTLIILVVNWVLTFVVEFVLVAVIGLQFVLLHR